MREEIKHYLTFKVFVLIATIYLDSQGSVLVAIYYIIIIILLTAILKVKKQGRIPSH